MIPLKKGKQIRIIPSLSDIYTVAVLFGVAKPLGLCFGAEALQ